MLGKSIFLWATSMLITLVFSGLTLAQKVDVTAENDPAQRIQIAPESVFTMFREAGMKPVNRELTPAQKEKVSHAFAKDNIELTRFEPMKNPLVKQRLEQLAAFYMP